ncbi:sigma-70 family RNA polymerase sigma factor [Sutcliffiella rhizosphaerae]|uniref:Uncharacterized protein n=1 Tax=Sutcliffiella rhizosphaerae TaxID=2880967 RepID=A0ABM8YRP3_9BACI|nr:sigma-70 family RNA polymerase sigma factor [Sutcliffiella rhizosphaerae]CAG9622673.1 hypothetical protein BACCIP111883_03464 [Sutcliffiella rhizosphaerae]
MHFLDKEEQYENWLCKDVDLKSKYQKLLSYCNFLTKNEWDGNDLAQETITKVIQHYHCSSVLSQTLLYKVAYNKWIDTVRKRQREILQESICEKGNYRDTVENSIIATDYLLNNLTPKQAVIFFLREAFNFQVTEIANILNTTEGAVKSTLHRTKKRLEKGDPEENEFIESFWSKEERELLPTLFQVSLHEEDPDVLVAAVPKIFAQTISNPSTPSHTPTNIYACVA